MPHPTAPDSCIRLPPPRCGETYRVVWFKRDLRVQDHAALVEAARAGPVLCLYVAEPGLWQQDETSRTHTRFIDASLRELDVALQELGAGLERVVGDVVEVLDRLHVLAPFEALHAHEETGGAWTFARDRAVARWCRQRGVRFVEHAQTGVVRGLRERDGWSRSWNRFMGSPVAAPPRLNGRALPWPAETPDLPALALHADDARDAQAGGRAERRRTNAGRLSRRARSRVSRRHFLPAQRADGLFATLTLSRPRLHRHARGRAGHAPRAG